MRWILVHSWFELQAPQKNAGQLVQAHYAQGYTQFYRGELKAAKEQFERALTFEVEGGDFSSQSASGDDTRTHVRCLLAHTYWHLGMPKTASKFAREAKELAHQLEQPYAITFTSFFNGWFHQLRREPVPTSTYAEECVNLAEENGYGFFVPLGRFLLAWSENCSPDTESSVEDQSSREKMQAFLEISLGTGVGTGVSYLVFLFAEVLVELGMYDEALEQLDQGLLHVETVGERFLESEYFRLKGCVFLARFKESKDRSQLNEAIDHLTAALTRAKIRQAKGLALRAAIDLAEALSQRGDSDIALETIDSMIRSFDEFDQSGDCIRAKELRKKLQ